MMKTNNIFDYMNTDIDNLSEQTVTEQTGVKTENVKEIFMNKVNAEKSSKNTKKHNKKKVFVVLAAAVAATLAVGTVTAGAAGSFNAAFGEHFAGERVNGIYSGGNVSIETNPEYTAELLGVTGDRYNAFAAVSFKRADGSNFVDNINDYYIDVQPWDCSNKTSFTNDTQEYEVPLTPIQEFQHRFENVMVDEYKFSEYDLTSSDTIKAIYNIQRDTYELTGQKMNVELKNIYLMRDISEVCQLEIVFDENITEEQREKNAEAAEQKIAEAGKTLKDNQIIHRSDNCRINENGTMVFTMTYTVTEYEKLNVDMKGSWKLNYKPAETTKDTADNTFSYQGIDYQVSDIEVGAVSANITLDITGGDISQFDSAESGDNVWVSNLTEKGVKITLKNGQVLNGMMIFSSTDDHKVTFSIMYFINEYDWTSVNPEEVTSIEIAGSVITK